MKKLYLIILILCTFSLQPLSAQQHSDLRHEIGVSAGPISLTGSVIYGSIGFWSALGGSISHKPIEMQLYGEYGLHYYYQIKPWCQVGVKTLVECAKLTHYSDTLRTTITAVDRYALASFMPSVRFTYLNRPWVRLYSGLELGFAYFWSGTTSYERGKENADKNNNFLFAFNVTAFGVKKKKKFFGMFELNAGYDSMITVGIGARF